MMASTSFELSSMDTSSAAYRRRKNADGANDDDARENPVKHHKLHLARLSCQPQYQNILPCSMG